MRLRIAALVGVASLALAGCGTLFEPTAAVVNGHKITVERVDAEGDAFEASPRFEELAKDAQAGVIRRQFEQSYLSQAISEDVIERAAAAEGVDATEEEVNAQIESIKKNFPTEKEFQAALAERVTSEAEFFRLVEDQILEQKLREKVTADSGPSESEIRSYYDAHRDEYRNVRVSHILVADKALAQSLSAQLQAAPVAERKKLFASLAKENSTDTQSAPKGGDLGFLPSNRLQPPPFAAAVEALKVNEVSDPVKSRFGYQVVLLVARIVRPLSAVRNSIENALGAPKADEAWTEWLKDAYADAEIRVNPRYGEFDVASRSVVDTPAEDVPGADVEATPSAPVPGQPQSSP
ncbi:MAG: hypothetical protein QOH90_309 [Actinomycetota bacterium]|nr:hypothetical protein [Actinomycetota bacterium]